MVSLLVTLDLEAGCFRFDWTQGEPPVSLARGVLAPTPLTEWLTFTLRWKLAVVGQARPEH